MPVPTAADPLALLALDDPELLLDAVIVTDRHGTITAVNRGFTRLHGYEPEDVVGHRPSVLSSGLQPSSFAAELWAAISAGRTWEGELIDLAADGRPRTVRSRITPVREPGGRICRYVAVQREVTPRGPGGAGQVRVDLRGRCTYADRRAGELLHRTGDAADLLGPGLLEGLRAEDAVALREVVEQAASTGRLHRVDLAAPRGFVRCRVRTDPSSTRLAGGPVAHVQCDAVPAGRGGAGGR